MICVTAVCDNCEKLVPLVVDPVGFDDDEDESPLADSIPEDWISVDMGVKFFDFCDFQCFSAWVKAYDKGTVTTT